MHVLIFGSPNVHSRWTSCSLHFAAPLSMGIVGHSMKSGKWNRLDKSCSYALQSKNCFLAEEDDCYYLDPHWLLRRQQFKAQILVTIGLNKDLRMSQNHSRPHSDTG